MNIQTITVTNSFEEELTIDMMRPEDSGLIITAIDGLGPVNSVISLIERSNFDGSVFNTAHRASRNIVLYFRFMHDVVLNRLKTYKYFAGKVKLRVQTKLRDVYTHGYIESNEVDIFSKEAGCVISIVCPDPYLYSSKKEEYELIYMAPAFGFPFPPQGSPYFLPLELGRIYENREKNLVYDGDVDVGFHIRVRAEGPVSGFSITSPRLEQIAISSPKLAQTTGSGIIFGDEIDISTIRGAKYAKLTRGDSEYNILNCLNPTIEWFRLYKGDNLFVFAALSGGEYLSITISHKIAYKGI